MKTIIEHGLQSSRTLVFIISATSLRSDWTLMERNTALFRDPANQQRRFVPVLIDDCKHQFPDTLRRFRHIDLRRMTKRNYQELLESCRTAEKRCRD
ncbi:MAG: toll/interleukin-1 receptor domain-containing protein [Candidatus Eisenbacteria bacterium]|uniref:Toll/interleukin-1 receptor domain-containing protein n=1 Tax=Eiseniibacteriota bacterium TaxID=2212470 RepID=A0A948W5W6_UNCEI|nr:toll/interleukin-1 receptor domain-containing protein [Candidatus Eisenbacteria bacterium]MBU2689996.1 toll/interleukin-1 receptor domain-containing protein [Candidatus Eisenbacteria bacterium]